MPADTAQLVAHLVRSLVDDPDSATIVEKHNGDDLVFEVTVAPDDVGKLIGRQGRIVKAIRTLARAAGSASGAHVDVEILG
ncbi:MAG TPA: KH domain-containing protein [Coriobacteriia bacterium]